MKENFISVYARLGLIFSLFFLCLFCNQVHATTLTSWNMEWLTSTPNHKIPNTFRSEKDLKKLNNYFQQINPHIIAFQEVSDSEIIKRIFGSEYTIITSSRSYPANRALQFRDTNQFTGFAFHRSLPVKHAKDLQLASTPESKLRFATYVILKDEASDIHLLSVHLKAGCRGKYKRNKSCRILKEEAKGLNAWILERKRNQQSFIILGDFNHNLAYPNDWLYKVITDNAQNTSRLVSQKTSADCIVRSAKNKSRTHRYKNLIDNIIASSDLRLTTPYQHTYTKNDVLNYKLSDHCPLVSKLIQ